MKHKNTSAFTLLEVLLAMFIFCLIAAITAGALYTAIHAEQGAKKHYQTMREWQHTVQHMREGLMQFVDHPLQNTRSDERIPSFSGTATQMAFTTTQAGLKNLFSYQSYDAKEATLRNQIWVRPNSYFILQPPVTHVLMHHVQVHFRYLDDKQQWHSHWQQKKTWPRAVEATISTSKRQMQFLFALPEAPL